MDEQTRPNRRAGEAPLPPHFRHNFTALVVDYVSFGVASAFVNPSTVLSAFARTLTASQPLIGLVGTTISAGWLLPQLGSAAALGGKPRKKPYMLRMLYVGRPLWFLLALATGAGLTRYPAAMLALLLLCVGLFFLTDGIASVAWFDILARAIPLSRRGRLIGVAQLCGGLLSTGVGALVGLILSSPRVPYPTSYALLFALSGLLLIPSTVALALLREPAGSAAEPSRTLRDWTKQMGGVWRGDASFRRMVLYRWLIGLMDLAIPFYILHATEVIHLPKVITGWFVSAQVLGGVAASMGLAWLSDRWGPRPVIRMGALTSLLAPLLALAIHMGLWPQAYPLVYFFIGISNSSWMLGPLNYMLERAPEGKRPLYVGLYNTMGGLLVAAPFLGGVLLRATSYPVLFAVAAAGVTAGLALSLRLQDPHAEIR